MARTDESIGRLERIRTLVEDIVAPSVRRLARQVFDCDEQQFFGTRVPLNRSDDCSREREFDALYLGLDEDRARLSASNGHGPWWNAGASHMNAALPKRYFAEHGLVSLLSRHRRLRMAS